MDYIRNLNKISKSDTFLAGGKGASLGEMTKAGIPVPPGFVIFSTAFEKFLDAKNLNVKIDSILHSINHKETRMIENASKKIKALILEAKIPQDITEQIIQFFKTLDAKYIAVRSSATAEDSVSAAWAGQLESYLNTTEKTLLENVKKCWASLFTPRAIFYRFEKNLHNHKISVAVVVQKMVNSEKSGIAFSVHPVMQNINQLIIEAGFGLGEAIVSGQITPDNYVVEKQPRRIIDRNIQTQVKGLYRAERGGNEWRDIPRKQGKKEVLSDKEIFELSEIILEIENHYGFPCDIEWATEKRKFYIIQSRPVTTFDEKSGLNSDNKIILEKQHTRDHPLIKLELWDLCNHEGMKKYLGSPVNNSLFWFNGHHQDIYSDLVELNKAFMRIYPIIKSLPKMRKMGVKFMDTIKAMKPYLDGKKQIKNQKELIFFFKEYKDYWPLMAIFFVIPNLQDIDIKISELALKFRSITQKYSDTFGTVFRQGIRNLIKDLRPREEDVLLLSEVLNNKIDHKILTERLRGYIYFDNHVYTGASITKLLKDKKINFIKENQYISRNELHGQVAYRGLVTGIANVIIIPKDLNKIRPQEILIAPMTTPDFLPAIHKAKAFITDEGGITCHAAIIARELKKPCIIGTKFATKILKDGDLIEVDANNGIIRVLKK